MIKRLSFLFLCIAVGVCAFVILDTWRFENLKPINKLQTLWDDDVAQMQDAHELPPGWSSVREIMLTPGDEQAKQWLQDLQIPVVVRKDGQFKLQVMLVTWDDEGKSGVYLQYDLTDLKTANDNTVWEDTRTFILSDEDSWFDRYFKHHKPAAQPPSALAPAKKKS